MARGQHKWNLQLPCDFLPVEELDTPRKRKDRKRKGHTKAQPVTELNLSVRRMRMNGNTLTEFSWNQLMSL